MCTNKACFVRFECDTRSIAQAYNILKNVIKYSMDGVIHDAKLKHWYNQ